MTNGGGQLFPGSSSAPETNWWEWERQHNHPIEPSTTSPGNTLLGKFLSKTHESGTPNCSDAEYSEALLDCIDANGNSGVCAGELVAAAQALKLNIGGNPTDAGPCAGSGGGASCDDARAKLKKAKKKLKKARGALKRARRSGDEAKVAKAKQKVKRAKKKLKKAKKKVRAAC